MPKRSLFTESEFWQQLLARLGRQEVQILIPVLALTAKGSFGDVHLIDVGWAALLAAVVTVAKALAGWTTDPTAALEVQIAERALAAGVGALAALLPIDPTAITSFDWPVLATSVLGSIGLSVTAMFTNTPTATKDLDLAA